MDLRPAEAASSKASRSLILGTCPLAAVAPRTEHYKTVALRVADALLEPIGALAAAGGTSLERASSSRGLQGPAGVALLYAAVLQSGDDRRYREALHSYIKCAAHTSGPLTLGLFSGLPGLLAACTYALIVEPRYSGLVRRCGDVLIDRSGDIQPFRPATSMYDYDIIAGAAGDAIASRSADMPALSRYNCDYLLWLLNDADRWMCPHPLRQADGPLHDLGMAHGVAGVAAALCLSAPAEHAYDVGIRTAAEFLCHHRRADPAAAWPASIGESGAFPGRSAWCYGTPGCSAALALVSRRLSDATYRVIALDALYELSALPIGQWNLQDNAICHGIAGDALVFLRVGQCLSDAYLVSVAFDLFDRVADAYDPSALFGYQAICPEGPVDSAAFLTGAAGIALALLTAANECDPSWVTYLGLP